MFRHVLIYPTLESECKKLREIGCDHWCHRFVTILVSLAVSWAVSVVTALTDREPVPVFKVEWWVDAYSCAQSYRFIKYVEVKFAIHMIHMYYIFIRGAVLSYVGGCVWFRRMFTSCFSEFGYSENGSFPSRHQIVGHGH